MKTKGLKKIRLESVVWDCGLKKIRFESVVWDFAEGSCGDSIWYPLRNSVGDSVGDSIWHSVWDSIRINVFPKVRRLNENKKF